MTSEQPSQPAALEELIQQHPLAQMQLMRHWLAAAVGLVPLALVAVAVQFAWVPQPLAASDPTQVSAVAWPVVIPLAVHSLLCLLVLSVFMNSGRVLRRDAGSDVGRIDQLVSYLARRRLWTLILAWLGQAVVVWAALHGLNFQNEPWLLLPLVPSFLLLSLSLRQPPTIQRLAAHVRRLRMVQQTQQMQ